MNSRSLSTSKKTIISLLLLTIMSTPGILCWAIYHWLLVPKLGISLSLLKQNGNVAVIMATFCFTMMTLLAGSIVIILSIGKSSFYDRYKAHGYFSILMAMYFFAVICLALNFFLSMLMLSSKPELFFNTSMIMSVNSMFHVLMLLYAFLTIHQKSSTN